MCLMVFLLGVSDRTDLLSHGSEQARAVLGYLLAVESIRSQMLVHEFLHTFLVVLPHVRSHTTLHDETINLSVCLRWKILYV